ncbi:MAG: alpha/beta hydrolase [Dehalococcoidales bacterium]|nr:alpha/beta hydrolase [Dehalococcoidales bacterium]
MPTTQTGDIRTFYEVYGNGFPMVFIHGGWVNQRMWKPQADYFSRNFKVITYDVRGHGQTGGSLKKRYSMELFADDLSALLEALEIKAPVICGLSMGGMIAQAYAAKYPHNLSALVLSDTAASSELTLSDRITKYLLAPEWLFTLMVRLFGVKKYAGFAFWYAGKTRSEKWAGMDKSVLEYEKSEMVRFETKEFNKIFSALYSFKLQHLSGMKVKVLIINGEFESKAVFLHTAEMKNLIPNAGSVIIPGAGHMSNLENPDVFNREMEKFLQEAGITHQG